MNEVYERLSKWAAKNNMQFKIQNDGGHMVYVWMCDAIDGYCGAECVCIHIQPDDDCYLQPAWLGYRFRLAKNERFIKMLIRNGVFEDTHEQWLGYDDSPAFSLPLFWRSERYRLDGKMGVLFWLDERDLTDEKVSVMTSAGCTMLESRSEYAPEQVSTVVFVPNGIRFDYSYGQGKGA